jgi:glycosyltransferase involved in cell wall biosynthesis
VSEHSGIAVVIPAYNCAAMVDDALCSVAAQTRAAEQVVVVDDGSIDSTSIAAARWCQRLPLEIVTLPENRGPGAARNVGVACTSSPLVAFMDADDVWLPDHLEICDAARLGDGAAIARALHLREDGSVVPVSSPEPPPEGQLDWIIRRNTFGMHAVLPRATVDEVGGFETAVEGAEDWDFWVRVARAGTRLRRVQQWTYLKRQHPANLSKRTEYIALASLRMLDRIDDELTPDERTELAGAFREARARIALFRAYGRLQEGDHRGARRSAVRALAGPPAVAARGFALATSPGLWKLAATSRRRLTAPRGNGSAPDHR